METHNIFGSQLRESNTFKSKPYLENFGPMGGESTYLVSPFQGHLVKQNIFIAIGY